MLDLFGGIEYRCTLDSRAAVGIFAEFQPDMVLTDLHMPHVDGFSLMEQLRALVPGESFLPMVVLTADVTPETRRKALASGASDFITKPLDTTEVQLRIRNLLENRFLNLRLEEQVMQRTSELEAALAQVRSAQESVVKQERLMALGTMAGGIAHDFNNALTMMLGYGEMLLPWFATNAPGTKEQGYMTHVVAAAQDATHVVSRLREFYRPAEAGDVRLPVCLGTLAEHVVDLTSPKWRRGARNGASIAVTTDIEKVPMVLGNAPELREVLTNLIFNAVDAMDEGGTITVRTRESDGKVRLDVTDTGCGMTPEEQTRCLEPFFTTKGERGTGLGLAVVYGIIQRHCGEIRIESEKGKGTTFSLLLPPTDIGASEVEDVADAVTGKSLHVLVVDDQEIICELISEYLRGDGHSVTGALDGKEAEARFAEASFDLVITDQSMPGQSGEVLARKLKSSRPDMPIILLTGFGDEMSATGQIPEGIDLVLGKPVSVSTLRRAMASVLE